MQTVKRDGAFGSILDFLIGPKHVPVVETVEKDPGLTWDEYRGVLLVESAINEVKREREKRMKRQQDRINPRV